MTQKPDVTDCQLISVEEVERAVISKRRRQALEAGCFLFVFFMLLMTFTVLGLLLLTGENHG